MAAIEEEALRKVADGDLVEFGIMCRRHATKLCNFAYRLLWSWSDAEEVAQETFFRIFKLALDGRFDEEPGAFYTAMYGIARSLCVDRGRERQETVTSDERDGTAGDEGPPADRPSCAVQDRFGQQIDEAFARLNPNHRAALLLADYIGLRYAEIAHVLNRSLIQVRMLVHNARKEVTNLVDRSKSPL